MVDFDKKADGTVSEMAFVTVVLDGTQREGESFEVLVDTPNLYEVPGSHKDAGGGRRTFVRAGEGEHNDEIPRSLTDYTPRSITTDSAPSSNMTRPVRARRSTASSWLPRIVNRLWRRLGRYEKPAWSRLPSTRPRSL